MSNPLFRVVLALLALAISIQAIYVTFGKPQSLPLQDHLMLALFLTAISIFSLYFVIAETIEIFQK